MPLPSCICVAGRPPFERLGDIFCALSQIDLECVIPEVVSATINASGETLTIVLTEEVTGHDGFVLFLDAGPEGLTYVSGEGTNTLVYLLDNPAPASVADLLNYLPGDVQSGAECPLAQFTDFPVTNNTGIQFVYLRPGGVDGYFRPGGVDTYIRP